MAIATDAQPADASPTCLEARFHSDFDWIETNIFEPSCSRFTVCHQGGVNGAEMLDLSRAAAIAAMVNIDSIQQPTMKLVVAGEPNNSYLMVKLGRGDQSLLGKNKTMPFNNPLLCDAKVEAIERWITAGAPDVPDAAPLDADPTLPDADLTDADLTDADLTDADTTDADLADAMQ